MNRLPLALALLVAVAPARADWTKIDESAGVAVYVDRAAITDADGTRRVPVLRDEAAAEGGVRSRRVTYEVDCARGRMRSVEVAEFAEPMGRAAPVATSAAVSEWLYVGPRTGSNLPPNPSLRAVLRFACER